MSFIETVKAWFVLVFDMVEDGFELVFSYDWTAYAFFAVFILGLLLMFAGLGSSVKETSFGVRQSDRGMTSANRSLDRALWLDRRNTEREVNAIKRANREEERQQRQVMLDQRRVELDQRRERMDLERDTKKRIQANREHYAQMLLNSNAYSQSRYVTIEGKRYYRKGLVSRGDKLKSSDRDFSGDLEDIDNS